MTIKLVVSSIVASIKLYLANSVLCLLWMLLYIHITLVGATSFTVNIADYVYVLTLSDIMVFYYGTLWLMMYVLLIHSRCLNTISDLTCLSNSNKVYFLVLFMSTIFNMGPSIKEVGKKVPFFTPRHPLRTSAPINVEDAEQLKCSVLIKQAFFVQPCRNMINYNYFDYNTSY